MASSSPHSVAHGSQNDDDDEVKKSRITSGAASTQQPAPAVAAAAAAPPSSTSGLEESLAGLSLGRFPSLPCRVFSALLSPDRSLLELLLEGSQTARLAADRPLAILLHNHFRADTRAEVTVVDDHSLIVLNAETNSKTRVYLFSMLRSPMQDVAISPGARFVIFALVKERPLLVAELSSGALLRQLVGPGEDPLYCSVGFSDNVRFAISGEEDGFVVVWNLGYITRDPVLRFKAFSDPVDFVASSDDFRLIAAGSCEGDLSLFRAENGELLGRFVGHRGQITSVTFWRNKYMASTSLDRSVRVWDLEGGCEAALLVRHRSAVRSLQFSPNGRFLVSASADCEALVWNLDTKLVETVITAPGPLLVAGLTEDMTRVVTACPDGSVHVWNSGLSGGRPLETLRAAGPILKARWDSSSDSLVAVLESGHVQKWAFP